MFSVGWASETHGIVSVEGEQVCTVPVTNVFVSAPRHAWLPGDRGNGSRSVKTFHFPVGLTLNLVSRGQRRHTAGKEVSLLVLECSLDRRGLQQDQLF